MGKGVLFLNSNFERNDSLNAGKKIKIIPYVKFSMKSFPRRVTTKKRGG
jgi:hypothetical protein